MEFPIGENGETTVNELIAALLTFPPNAKIQIYCDFMQDTYMRVETENGSSETILGP